MKPASVINQGDSFVTLRATTDRPAEIREALAARDVQHVYKGDQNQAWDAVLANHCLSRAVGDSEAEITFFVQDERLGTSDARLTRHWRREARRYVLTEDYYRGRAGAVWEHQDVSHGLFFTEAVSPEQFAEAGVHLPRTAEAWQRHAAAILGDREWLRAISSLGVTIPGNEAQHTPDEATRLGPASDVAALEQLFADHPTAWLYYALTKTDGLYGVTPVENDNVTMSSIPVADSDMLAVGRRLLFLAGRGAMRLAASSAHRRGVKLRTRELGAWVDAFIKDRPEASVTDFQQALGRRINEEIFPADRIELDRTSRFTHLDEEKLPALRTPERTLYFFFNLALRCPAEFTDAYNEALNRAGLGLQRMKYEPSTGRYTPPFFVEFAPSGDGGPVYRYGIELTGRERSTLRLIHPTGADILVDADRRITSVHDFAEALLRSGEVPAGFALVGKAATFAAELQRTPRGLGLPRQGSKYAPMVDHLVSGLRVRGVLDQPTGLLIRIGLNALDRLGAMGELPLRLPSFLEGALGQTVTCREFSAGWRDAAAEARGMLGLLGRFKLGQHVHLTRVMALNARGGDLSAALDSDPRLRSLLRAIESVPEARALLGRLGADLPLEAVSCIERLSARRLELLAERRECVAEAQRRHQGGRLVPGWAEDARDELDRIECELLLIFAAYVRRLWQRAESLPYLNDRPYTLALYLLFGRDIFPPICRQVEFDVEYVSPCPVRTEGREPSRCR
ncbi:MAG: hypothetical protein ACO1SX_12680 [Actinomycetota bacterium]